ncbi:hypothetical protein [Umezawaea sp. NPDC059074]|uniref:hypothetical protein n=1 Tax=Umezawaea sp. NPDC059074 TaxID=3346716 RepID=UPI0036A37EDE
MRRTAGIAEGGVAGAAGGLVFGATMGVFGMLPTVASIVRTDSVEVGFVVHMAIAVVIGTGFGMLVVRRRVRVSETVFWGLLYGAFWWFLGPQTLLPLLRGTAVAWDVAGARTVLPSLFGHLCYGVVLAAVFVLTRRNHAATRARWRVDAVGRGAVAGLVCAAVGGPDVGRLVLGAVVGACYPLLFTARPEATGPALIRGTVYGFLWWVLLRLSLEPLLRNGSLDWSPDASTAAVDRLPGYLLLGAGTAVLFTWFGALARGLFVDDVRVFQAEAPGGRGLRATGYGALAGLAGGAVFTAVMVLVGALPTVARIMGASSPAAGLVVHLVISQVIGVSYAVLFRRRSFDPVSGIGWGVSYGFFWWVLGNLTLLPLLTGGHVDWSAAGLAAGFPSLVGHLGYGAALGAVYQWLESRANPWWVTRSEAEAARATARREQVLGSAPALWVLTVLIAVTLPVLVG